MTTRTLLLPGRRSDSFYAWAETLRVVKWNPSRAARDISLFFRSNFPVRLFQIPCSVILNSLLFRNRELPANHLKYRGLPRQKTAGSAQKWPKFPVFPCYSWLPAETGSLQPAPSATQSCKLWHCRDAMRFSARFAGFCRGFAGVGGTRDALEGRNGASFLGFVSNRDFRVPRLRPVGERALTGPCSVGKEATRGVQNRGQGYRGVAG